MTAAVRSESPPTERHVARLVLLSFLLTFIAARILVFLIMARKIPDLYLHLGGNHIHHLNYGIFLLAGVGGYLLFRNPGGRALETVAVAYGIGMALTFDEFGMWVRLGGPYWQRQSLDAIGVLSALFGLIAYAPSLKKFRPRHWWSVLLLAVLVPVFFVMLANSSRYADEKLGPKFRQLESGQPP